MIPGDANLDGTVDAIDLNPLALRWRADDPAWSAGNFVPPFDRIDANDLNVIGSNWQRSNKAITAAVPEPGGIRWMLLGVLPIGFLRRTAYMS